MLLPELLDEDELDLPNDGALSSSSCSCVLFLVLLIGDDDEDEDEGECELRWEAFVRLLFEIDDEEEDEGEDARELLSMLAEETLWLSIVWSPFSLSMVESSTPEPEEPLK